MQYKRSARILKKLLPAVLPASLAGARARESFQGAKNKIDTAISNQAVKDTNEAQQWVNQNEGVVRQLEDSVRNKYLPKVTNQIGTSINNLLGTTQNLQLPSNFSLQGAFPSRFTTELKQQVQQQSAVTQPAPAAVPNYAAGAFGMKKQAGPVGNIARRAFGVGKALASNAGAKTVGNLATVAGAPGRQVFKRTGGATGAVSNRLYEAGKRLKGWGDQQLLNTGAFKATIDPRGKQHITSSIPGLNLLRRGTQSAPVLAATDYHIGAPVRNSIFGHPVLNQEGYAESMADPNSVRNRYPTLAALSDRVSSLTNSPIGTASRFLTPAEAVWQGTNWLGSKAWDVAQPAVNKHIVRPVVGQYLTERLQNDPIISRFKNAIPGQSASQAIDLGIHNYVQSHYGDGRPFVPTQQLTQPQAVQQPVAQTAPETIPNYAAQTAYDPASFGQRSKIQTANTL